MSQYYRNYTTGNLPTIPEQGVWVDGQTGSDTTGTGSAINPFATLTKAYSTILDATTSKRYAIFLIGTVTEDVSVKPWTGICGFGKLNSIINGTLTLDATAWSSVDGTFSLLNLNALVISFNNSGITSCTPTIFISGVDVSGNATFTGGTNEGSLEIWDSNVDDTLTTSDYALESYNTNYLGFSYDRPNNIGLGLDLVYGGSISIGTPDPNISNTGGGTISFLLRDVLIGGDILVDGGIIVTYDMASYPQGGFIFANGGSARSYISTPNNVARTSVTAATYTVLLSDSVLLCNRAGAIALTLPDPATNFVLEVKDISGNAAVNNITLTPAAGNIDGAASYVINTNYGAVKVFGDGTNYWVMYG